MAALDSHSGIGAPAGRLLNVLRHHGPGHLRAMIGFAIVSNLMVLAPSFHMLQVYDRVLASGSTATLIYVTLIAIAALGVYAYSETARLRIAQRFAAAYSVLVARTMFARLAQMPDESGAASASLRDYGAVKSFFGSKVFVSLFDLPFLPLFLLLLYFVHPVIFLVTLAGSAVLIGMGYLNAKLGEASRAASRKADADAVGFAQTAFGHAGHVRAMGLLPTFINVWGQKSAAGLVCAEEAARVSSAYYAVSKAFRQVLQVVIMAWGAWLVLAGDMSGGMIFMASMISGKALAPIEQLIGSWETISKSLPALDNIEKLTGDDKSLKPRPPMPQPRGYLTAEGLVYQASPQSKRLIDNVSLQVVPGEIVAIAGPSGSGKSLLTRLLAGALSPTAGAILLDMASQEQYPTAQWGRNVGYLSDDFVLFPGTVAANIARFDSAADMNSVYEAAKRAGAHDAIVGLPNGYQTRIGDGSTWLTIANKQQIALARAFYGKPRVLILDQPTSHLDQAGEGALVNALGDARSEGAAIIVVSRRGTIMNLADRRIIIVNGRAEAIQPEPRLRVPAAPAMHAAPSEMAAS